MVWGSDRQPYLCERLVETAGSRGAARAVALVMSVTLPPDHCGCMRKDRATGMLPLSVRGAPASPSAGGPPGAPASPPEEAAAAPAAAIPRSSAVRIANYYAFVAHLFEARSTRQKRREQAFDASLSRH